MKKSTVAIIAVVVVVAVALFALVGSYNSMVSQREAVDTSFSDIQAQLQRRLDLVPNLVETVKGYAAHESEVIQAVSDARAKLAGASAPDEKAAADTELSTALSRLLVVVENYPDLKANQNFIGLTDELAGTENRIAVKREDYNAAAKAYNTKIQFFPNNIIAAMFGFEKVSYFEAGEGAEDAPKVEF